MRVARVLRVVFRVLVAGVAGCVAALGVGRAGANPLPYPPNHEKIWVTVDEPLIGQPHASFHGAFQFESLPDTVTTMSFPIPPGAMFESVYQPDIWLDWYPLDWRWSDGPWYPTILPDMPLMPQIEWTLIPPEFRASVVQLSVRYNHDLLARPGEYVFLYATGSGKYAEGYVSGIDAEFEITFPPRLQVKSVHLDHTPHPYTIEGNQVDILVETFETPETRDLIVIFEPVEFCDLWVVR